LERWEKPIRREDVLTPFVISIQGNHPIVTAKIISISDPVTGERFRDLNTPEHVALTNDVQGMFDASLEALSDAPHGNCIEGNRRPHLQGYCCDDGSSLIASPAVCANNRLSARLSTTAHGRATQNPRNLTGG
jgi:hypothetical protein